MSAPLFTPGPWITETGDSVVKIFGNHQYIAVTASKAYWQRHDETDVANANLIAAAPELYVVLEAALAHIGRDHVLSGRIGAALARARGQS